MMKFNLLEYKTTLLNQLKDKNKTETSSLEIVRDYKYLYNKYLTLNEKCAALDKELLSFKNTSE